MIPTNQPLNILSLSVVTETASELFVEIQRARKALGNDKLAKADRLASAVLANVQTRALNNRRTYATSPAAQSKLRAAAMSILGLVAHRQGRVREAIDLLRAAVFQWTGLIDQGQHLDSAARAEYVEALLLIDQGEAASIALREMLDAGADVPVDQLIATATWLDDQGHWAGAIDLLAAAQERRPEEPTFAASLAFTLARAGRLDEAGQVHVEAAVLLAARDDLPGAEAHFRHALKAVPSFGSAMAGLTQVLLMQGKVSDAIETVGLENARGDAGEIIALRATALSAAGRYDDAFDVTQRGLTVLGDNPLLLEVYVTLLVQMDRLDDAFVGVQRALEVDRDDADMRLLLARLLLEKDRPDEAIGILGRLREELPETAEIPAVLAHALAAIGRDDDAAVAMQDAIRLAPDASEVVEERSRLVDKWTTFASERFQHFSRDPEVKGALEHVLSIAPESSLAHAILGEILRQEGRYAEAKEHLERAQSMEPNSGWIVGTLGQVLNAMGRPDATEVLERAADLDDSLYWVHADLADAYRVAGRLPEALREVERAVELNSDDAWSWAVKGATEMLSEQWEDARSSLDRALRDHPDYAWALAVKASLLAEIDEEREAFDLVTRAVAADGSMPWAWGLQAWLLNALGEDPAEEEVAARTAFQLADKDPFYYIILAESMLRRYDEDSKANEYFRKAVSLFQQTPVSTADPGTLRNVAWAYLRLGEFDEALNCLAASLARDSTRIPPRFTLGLALLCAGRDSLAISEYRSAVSEARSEPHPGRRRALLKEASGDVHRMLRQKRLRERPEVSNVLTFIASADSSLHRAAQG